MLVVYFLPIATYLKHKHSRISNPEMATLIKIATVSPMQSRKQSLTASPQTSMLELGPDDVNSVLIKQYSSEKTRRREFNLSAVAGVICCVYSVFVFVIQIKGLFD